MYFVNPKDIERFYLRLLLLHVKGAKSYNDIKTVNGVLYSSFLNAAKAYNFIAADDEWDKCLSEAVQLKFMHYVNYLHIY